MAISKHDKQALADLFMHMGVPLVRAIQTVKSWSGDEEPLSKETEKLAKLLNISVEFATKLTKKLEIRDSYTLENVRGKIIRIVTPIIADAYVSGGNTPEESYIEELTALFDVLLSFAESVSPTDEKGSKPQKIATLVEACEPILTAIQNDPLDHDPKDIFDKSVGGIMGRAEQLAPELGVDDVINSGLFQSIVRIYVGCYMNTSETGQSGEEALKEIWTSCDTKLALIQGLTGFVAKSAGIDQTAPKQEKESVKEEIKTEPAAETKKIETKDKAADDDKQSDENSEDDDNDDFNPMSFFTGDK